VKEKEIAKPVVGLFSIWSTMLATVISPLFIFFSLSCSLTSGQLLKLCLSFSLSWLGLSILLVNVAFACESATLYILWDFYEFRKFSPLSPCALSHISHTDNLVANPMGLLMCMLLEPIDPIVIYVQGTVIRLLSTWLDFVVFFYLCAHAFCRFVV